MHTRSFLSPGSVVGVDFAIVRLLGSGGMGSVYVAEQRSTGKLRALKMMHHDGAPDVDLVRRFEQEARVGARIQSGHVVEVVAAGVDPATGLPYLVMELLDGRDLRAHLRERGALPLDEVRTIFEQLCHGVAAAHRAGVVHRDLKPENIFLARPNHAGGGASIVKVLDFGIAKLASESTHQTTAAVGSPLWMAPEQTTPGPVTPGADVWALGLIAYELLVGSPFWNGARIPSTSPIFLLREIVLEPIPAASVRGGARLPAGFDAWFARCVVRDVNSRFQNAHELWQSMIAFLPPEPGASLRPAASGPEAFAPTMTPDASAREARRAQVPGETPLALGPLAPSVPPTKASPTRTILPGAVATGVGAAGLLAALALAHRTSQPVSAVTPPPLLVSGAATTEATASALASEATSAGLETRAAAPPSRAAGVTKEAMPPKEPLRGSLMGPAGANSKVTEARGDDAPGHPPTAAPRGTSRDGFSDPQDDARAGSTAPRAVTTLVQGHRIRLLTRLLSNDGNVRDDVVRRALEWSSWEYLRCYESAFGSSKDLPEGTVTVSFDILGQLPRHAALVSSTFTSPSLSQCVVGTLGGHTMNAAGAEGTGHGAYAFKFIAD